MKRTLFSNLTAVVFVITLVGACAPVVGPAPPPAPASAPQAAPVTSALSPEEAEWQKVVEAAKKEGKLIAYSYYMAGDTGVRMQQVFKSSTGLNLEVITSTGAVLIERVKAERRGGFQVASVLDTAPVLLEQAKVEGLTEAAGPLPELQNKEVWKVSPIVDKEGRILASSVALYTPWINTKLVKPGEEPKSWRDLLQPRWTKKISMADPDTAPVAIEVYYQLVKKHGILDDAYFRELGKQVVLSPNIRMDANELAMGNMAISFASTPSPMGPFLQAGVPLKAIDMEEGVVAVRATGVSIISQAPHPNAARVFLNWWFSREGQLSFHESYGTESVRKDVPDFTPLPGRLTPKKVLWESADDGMEGAKIQRERVLKKLLLGK